MKFTTLAVLAATVVADDSNMSWYEFECEDDMGCDMDMYCADNFEVNEELM